MKGFYKSIFVSLIIALFISLFPKYTYALLPISQFKLKLDPKIVSCTVISDKYDQKTALLSNAYKYHIETYAKLVDRLENMIERWQELGYNTKEIEEDLNQLEILIQEYKDDFDDLEEKLTAAKNACSNTNYISKLTEARDALKEVRRDVVDIRVLYQTEIRKAVLDLKKQEIN